MEWEARQGRALAAIDARPRAPGTVRRRLDDVARILSRLHTTPAVFVGGTERGERQAAAGDVTASQLGSGHASRGPRGALQFRLRREVTGCVLISMKPVTLRLRRAGEPFGRGIAVALLAGLTACSSQSVARSVASTVRVEGVRALSADEVDGLFNGADEPGGRERGALLLQVELYNRGYLDVRVTEHVARDGATVLVVEEGPRFHTGQVSVLAQCSSREKPDLAALQARLRAAASGPFSRHALDDGTRTFLEALREAGHAHASVESDVKTHDGSRAADITLSVLVGPVVTVERLHLASDLASDLVPLRDRIALREGEPLRASAVDATMRSLRAAFPERSVSVWWEVSPTRADRAVVTVTATAPAGAPPPPPPGPPTPMPPTKSDLPCERAFHGVAAP